MKKRLFIGIILAIILIVILFGLNLVFNDKFDERNSYEDSESEQDSSIDSIGLYDGAAEEQQENLHINNESREVLEIPSEAERAILPECSDILYTISYVKIENINAITPLGNVDPPDHTIPTNHVYTHFSAGGMSKKTYELFAPADIWILHIYSNFGITQDSEDHTIYFAVCKDVIGYFNHVKKLTPEINGIIKKECGEEGIADNKDCFVETLEPVAAGTVLGEVGGLQGNFDFGTIDLRTEHDFVNKERYAKRTLHIQCALDYYNEDLKNEYYSLLARKDGSCGKINYDLLNTLQGNWFYGGATEFYGGDWTKHAFFGYDNEKPELAVISIGGTIVPDNEGLRWTFTPEDIGTENRRFADIKADGNIYCYDKNNEDEFNIGPKGKILVKMMTDEELKVEFQEGSCSGNLSFTSDAKIYER